MGFADLPPEILHLILGFLIYNQKSMSNLCTVDKRTYSVSYSRLYQSVTLTSDRALLAFCQPYVLGIRQPIHSPLVTELNIGPYWPWRARIDSSGFRLLRNHVQYLQRVLENLENLKYLSLSVSPRALNLVLDDLVVPFKLESFAHSGKSSINLLCFLEGQPLIKYLGWYGAASQIDIDLFCVSMKSNSRILPNLEALDGPLHLLSSLLPLRPISNITIVQPYSPWNKEEFIAALHRTTVPLTRLCVCEASDIWHTWMEIVSIAELTNLPYTLKHLRIAVKPISILGELRFQRNMVNQLSRALGDLSFSVMEEFELTGVRATHWDPPACHVYSWLAREILRNLSDWRVHVLSLKKVVVYGIVIS
ncbi:unnamed protein product [Rhizoctonia solani]|uniref:F-box domain-containing protein n=1 Tax=Rhizoctonia solani TaxID=456999 RepID=A0A8H3CV57_9AGAM|nr:unnamed protein product [Rhizoctonia solani]